MEHLKMETKDIASENFEKLKALFPNCVTESLDKDGNPVRAIDKDLLMQEINSEVVEGQKERYQFNWPGKRDAIRKANAPTTMTLRPCKDESVDFDNTQNLYIEGDNLEVLKLLQNNYLGKVKMIYIDPPYNTGNDFVYNDNFKQDSETFLETSGMFDEDGNMTLQNFEKNSESNGRFHTDWLNMMYPRLKVARNLLSDDGVIFISIDDNEQENLKKICDEIFGDCNYVGKIAVVNNLKGRNDRKDIATCHEYIVIYGKSEFIAGGMPLTEEQKSKFDKTDEHGNKYQLRDLRKRGRPDRREDRPNMFFPIYFNKNTQECSLEYHENWVEIFPKRGDDSDGRWRWGKQKVASCLNILEPFYSEIAQRWGIRHRVYLNPGLNPATLSDDEDEESEERVSKSKSFWMGAEFSSDIGRRQLKKLFTEAYFDYPKSIDYILNTLYMGADSDSIILDFFSGSATTAHAVMQLNAEDNGNRKFICVQLPEVTAEDSEAYKAGYKTICEIGKERIRRAGKKIKEESGEKAKDLDIGFRVLKLAESNMNDVYYKPADIDQGFLDKLDTNIKRDRTPMDLLFQIMLECDLELSSKIEEREINGKKVFFVNDKELVACFDENIDEATITEIAKLKPYYFVMRDSSLATDNVADNFEQLWNAYSKDTIRKVL
ncbi:site-specific DNA-methyltransferase [Fibrobacter sp.]|uniref:site-specific DNA-methyltransferase n=1 Tax=Fibrobacter sp. TaxID=35828 RepID=UPI00386566FB